MQSANRHIHPTALTATLIATKTAPSASAKAKFP
jgi:hypothetical protein